MVDRETFFTTVGCMDGRVQEPVTRFGQEKFGAKYPDTITEAGLAGALSRNPSVEVLKVLKNKLDISLQKHKSCGIIIHGHEDCAGNPVTREQHKKDILAAAQKIRSSIGDAVRVIPVFVKRVGEAWVVESLADLL